MGTFNEWLDIFLEEKNAPYASWELTDPDGITHWIDSEVVVEFIKNECNADEKKKIKSTLVMIDFKNGDVNHFLKHLAQGMVNLYATA